MTEDVALRALSTIVMGGVTFAVVPMTFLGWLMLRREDVPSFTALVFGGIVLVAEILATGIARPPPEFGGPWNLRSMLGFVLVPAAGAGAAWGLLWRHEKRRSQARGR